jgi:hypothetical protein
MLSCRTRRPRAAQLVVAALTILVTILAATPASGLEFTFWGQTIRLELTNTLDAAYHADNDDNQDPRDPFDQEADDRYGHIFNTLNAAVAWGDLAAGVRLDVFAFIDPPAPPPARASSYAYSDRYGDRVIPEKLHLTLSRPAFDLYLGDFNVSFGRGLALHIVSRDELAEDTTIRGGRLTVHTGGTEVTFLAGQANALNLDQVTGYRVEDPDEIVLAGRVEQRIVGPLRLGLHLVHVLNDTGQQASIRFDDHDYDLVWGATLEAESVFDWVDLYLEADLQRTRRFGTIIRGPGAPALTGLGADPLPGLAVYGALNSALGPAQLLLEGAYYDGFELKATLPTNSPRDILYHRPPTLDRIDVLVEDNTRLWGLRARVDWQFDELRLGGRELGELALHINYSYFHNWFAAPERIQHPFGGFEWSWGGGHLSASVGRRWETNRETGTQVKHTWQADWKVQQLILKRVTLTHEGVFRDRSTPATFGSKTWRELDLSLGLKWSPYLLVAGSYEYTDETLRPGDRQHHVSGVVQVFITSGTYVRLMVGQTRGGLKCVAGVCRIYPPFAGARLTGVARF